MRRTIDNQNKEKGFTIIEMLVAITITGILITVVYMAYHFSLRHLRTWEKLSVLERESSIIAQQLRSDILESQKVKNTGLSEWEIVGLDGKEIWYQFQEGTLLRNQFPMNKEEVCITAFDMQPVKFGELNDSRMGDFSEGVDLNQSLYDSGIRLICTLESNGKTIDLSCNLRPRNQHLNEFELDR